MLIRKALVYDLLGSKCAQCGFDDIRALQVDHVNGNGGEERKIYKGGQTVLYRMILDAWGEGYQLLCANCNWIKRVSSGESACIYPEKEYKNVIEGIRGLRIRRRQPLIDNFEEAKEGMRKKRRIAHARDI